LILLEVTQTLHLNDIIQVYQAPTNNTLFTRQLQMTYKNHTKRNSDAAALDLAAFAVLGQQRIKLRSNNSYAIFAIYVN
jgi:hypothetical protein